MGRREKPVTTEPNTIGSLGATLRRARQAKNVSLSDLAHRLGYSKSHLSVVETGRIWPSRELLQAYEAALDIKGATLLQLADSLAPLRRSRAPASATGASVESLLLQLARGVGKSLDYGSCEPGALPANGATTRDPDTAVRWAVELADWASANRLQNPRNSITLVTLSNTQGLQSTSENASHFQAAVQRALANGWDVDHIRWLNGTEEDRIRQYTQSLSFYGFEGAYRPFGLPLTRGLPTPPYGLMAVPGRGALMLMPTRTDRLGQYAVYAAIFFDEPEAISVVADHAGALRERAQPLVSAFERPVDWFEAEVPDETWLQFSEASSRSVIQPGDRFLVRDGLGSLAIPADPHWEHQWLQRKTHTAWDSFARVLQADRVLRQTAFRDQVRNFQFRDIFSRRAIERFASEGMAVADDLWPKVATVEQRIARLDSMVGLLKVHQHYEIGILDDPPDWMTPDAWWLVKGGATDGFVFLESTYRRAGAQVQLHLELTDPMVVTAMRDRFQSLWGSLSPGNRTKAPVIDYLTSVIRRLDSRR
ncbi:MAG: helix-turn-helix transcriptional regulator [Dehalococcoidia bacterium]